MEPLEKIKGILHENGIEVTVKQVPDKIHSLRNYYSAERRKEEAATKKSDPGQDDLYISKWLFFQPLLFLRNNLIPRVTDLKWKLCKILEKEKYLAQYLEKCQSKKKIMQ